MGNQVPGLEIAAVVDEIRTQLVAAADRSAGQAVRFEVGDIELEFGVAVTEADSSSGGVKVWVLNAQGNSTTSFSATHRVKVTLKAQDMERGESVRISDSSEVRPPR